MENRIKKLSSWAVPIIVIAGVLYLTVASIGGEIENPQKYAAAQVSSLKPHFASISAAWGKILTILSPAQTVPEPPPESSEPPADSSALVSTPSFQEQESASSSPERKTAPPSPPAKTGAKKPPVFLNSRASSADTNVPDLAIEVIDTGILNGEVFTHATSVELGQRAAVVFDVKNIGKRISPEWNFSARIPTPAAEFTSETQSPLGPGDGIRFTMAFSNLERNGTNTISFTVDPNTKVLNDQSRSNNAASAMLYRNY